MFGMGDMGKLMKLMGQAGKIQENMKQAQARAAQKQVTGEAGSGLVKVTATGNGEVLSVTFAPEALHDAAALGPLVTEAVNVALVNSKEAMKEEMRVAMDGVELPPGMNLPF